MHFRHDIGAIGRLAWPNLLGFGTQLLMVAVDGAVAARLGASELAAIALILPIQMLLIQTAHGAFGAATAGNVARAVGARDMTAARNVAAHALSVALIVSVGLAIIGWTFSAQILHAAGGQGRILELAASYLVVLFATGIPIWLNGALIGIARGAKMMWLPTFSMGATAIVHVGVAPALSLGWFGLPALGLQGLAWSYLLCYTLLLAPLGYILVRERLLARVFPETWDMGLLRLMRQTAGMAVIASALNNLSVMLSTRLVSAYGPETLAGYGLAARLEYAIAPLVFSVGTALIVLCGQARGAGDMALARRYAITGVSVATVVVGILGAAITIEPDLWLRWFAAPPAVAQEGRDYLRVTAFSYAFLGAGLTAFFASQAFGDMLRPMFGAVFRIVIILIGSAIAGAWFSAETWPLYIVFAVAFVVYGTNNILAVLHLAKDDRATPAAGPPEPAELARR